MEPFLFVLNVAVGRDKLKLLFGIIIWLAVMGVFFPLDLFDIADHVVSPDTPVKLLDDFKFHVALTGSLPKVTLQSLIAVSS
ncbi:hypothetical protein KGMB02408_17520 [Bacteroides faecalis]|uniref:Uncharacterized protein n=1 Tax=Bacteroides faecalis TaxID=2447885 RepID=A0A401LTR3_9BACE|nr:hypothetical protein KGMB02408_17520 [Bacteroides faecalis]